VTLGKTRAARALKEDDAGKDRGIAFLKHQKTKGEGQ
tara:strand:+ start:656 stop:766 length:111 start_codon:yes stop_codon:yes gene_type:complete